MPIPASILVCGHDARLLEIRRWVLEKESARVYTTQKLSSMGKIIAAEKIDLVVFCHTLSDYELNRMLDTIENFQPHVRSIVLTSSHFGSRTAGRGLILNASDGPKALIDAVRSILQADYLS